MKEVRRVFFEEKIWTLKKPYQDRVHVIVLTLKQISFVQLIPKLICIILRREDFFK